MDEKEKEKEKKDDEGTSEIATKIIARENDMKIEEEVIIKLDKLIKWVKDQLKLIHPYVVDDKNDPIVEIYANKENLEKVQIAEEIQLLRNCD
jgi:hypothetical protein